MNARIEAAMAGRARAAVVRKAATADRLAAIATRSGPTGFRVGWKVRTNTPRSHRFHDRLGVVVTNNLGEVGVAFPGDKAEKDPTQVDAWFLPRELEHIK